MLVTHLLNITLIGDTINVQFEVLRQYRSKLPRKAVIYSKAGSVQTNYFKEVLQIKNNLAKKIRNLRKKSGLTQAQLADKLDISASAVGMYEQGRREPDNKTLSKICRILDASGDYVLDLDKASELHETKSDIYSVISDFIKKLESQDDLMFNGEPINKAEKKKITSALKVATAITLSDIDHTM